MQMLTPTLPLYIIGLSGSETDVGLAVGAFMSTAVVVRLLATSAADDWGMKRVLLGSASAFAACGLPVPLMPSVLTIILLRGLHGEGRRSRLWCRGRTETGGGQT
jgi:MFS family permease